MHEQWFGTRTTFIDKWNAGTSIDDVREQLGRTAAALTPEQLRVDRQKLTRYANHLRKLGFDLKFFRGGPGRHYNAGPRKPKVVEPAKPSLLDEALGVAKRALSVNAGAVKVLPAAGYASWEALAERLATLMHVTVVDAGHAGGRKWRALVVDQDEVGRGNCWQRIVELLVLRAANQKEPS